MKKVSVMLMVGLVCVWVSGVSAALLTVDGTAVVDDNFENASSVSSNDAGGDSLDADPDNAILGSWSITENPANTIQVTNYGTPGAYEGNNYLREYRASGAAYPKAVLTGTRYTSGTAHLEVMVYAKDDSHDGVSVFMVDSANSKLITSIHFSGFGSTKGYITTYDGAYHNTGIQYAVGEWKKLEIDWVIGSSYYDLTYDGQTKSNIVVRDHADGLDGVQFSSSVGAVSGFDAVPEPATIGLLAMGFIGLLRKK